MKTFERFAAQGELFFERIDALPAGVAPVEPEGEHYIIGHSETGHHHVLDRPKVRVYSLPKEIMECFVVVGDEPAELTHLRPHDTHEALRLDKGATYRVRRRREYVPEGFRMVAD